MLNNGLKLKIRNKRPIKVFLIAKGENTGTGGYAPAIDASFNALEL